TEAPMEEVKPTEAPMEAAYTQAPMLDEMVKAGTLPPIEERLPENPFVVGPGVYMTEENLPDWAPGKYGGTLRSQSSVANWNADLFVAMNEPFLMAPKIGDQNIVCNVCEKYEVSDGNKVFTFTLRKNLKWSDGEPVTTEDVRFAWEDIRNDKDVSPSGVPNQWRTGFSPTGNPAKVDIIDDFTFKVTFDGPYGSFLRALTIEGWVGYTQVLEPSHYLKQFHTKYTPIEDLKVELDKLNLTNEWWQVFSSKRCQNWDMTNPRCADYPALNPWIGKPSDNPALTKFERNPYYFKVDTTGQQLPYIDYMTSQMVNDIEMVTLKIVAGEVDFQRESTALVKIPLYKENEEKAGFRVVLTDMHVDSTGLRFNETFNDANWQKVSQDIRFRQATSMAINRQEPIDTIYYGYASFPLKTMGEANSTYDVEGANKLLDEMGLTEKDGDGYRKYADGKVIEILLEHGAHAPDISPVADLTAQYLKEIGLKVTVKQIDSSLWGTKWAANEIQATIMWSHDIGWGNDVVSGSVDRAGVLWSTYVNSNGNQGVQPPDWAMKAYEIDAAKWAAVAGSDEYNAKVEEGFKWAQENMPYINYVEYVKYPLVVNKNLMNVPSGGYAIGANFSIVQMYFDK
ncbi:MAG: ABC transporter substrate-binding protein, partial [Anaerolineaceae bacterium]|nr:ABC transporter substrate-binding protein [Anaerolineaceae bacterium]